MRRGLFVVIDGIGGSGKSTQIKMLKKRLPGAVFTKEPGGAPRTEHIRAVLKEGDGPAPDPLTDFFLFWGARAEHMASVVRPALLKGKAVVTDRFDSSTFAMQVRGEKKKEYEKLFWQCRETTLGKFKPDIYIILDIAPNIAKGHRTGRNDGRDRFDDRDEAYQKRIRTGYKEFAKKIKGHVIDASKGLEYTHEQIWRIVEKKLR